MEPRCHSHRSHLDHYFLVPNVYVKGPLPYKYFLPHPYPPTPILPTPILSAPALFASHTSLLLAPFYSQQLQPCSLIEIFCFLPLCDEPTPFFCHKKSVCKNSLSFSCDSMIMACIQLKPTPTLFTDWNPSLMPWPLLQWVTSIHSQKKTEPKNPVTAFFQAKLGKILKILRRF